MIHEILGASIIAFVAGLIIGVFVGQKHDRITVVLPDGIPVDAEPSAPLNEPPEDEEEPAPETSSEPDTKPKPVERTGGVHQKSYKS